MIETEGGHRMKIVIPGGSGQVGTLLARRFHSQRHEVVILSRPPLERHPELPWKIVAWDGRLPGAWSAEIDGADVVINLAGQSMNCRYNDDNRQRILDSRIDSTRAVGGAIRAAKEPPAVWLQASTATIYSHRFDAENDDVGGQLGGEEIDLPETWRFSLDVATAWEREVDRFDLPRTRVVKLRSAVVMNPDRDSAFDTLLGLVRRGLGGRAGDGRQFVSWIHEDDFLESIAWILEHDELSGAVNLASPHPLPNAEFMQALRTAAGIHLGLPATRWMLELGALLLDTETELVMKSRRVTPRRLLESGFRFRFPHWPKASQDLVDRWRDRRRAA